MSREIRLRPEGPADWGAIDAVHEQAFGRPGEAALVRAGLERCAAIARIVVVLGHAAYYPRFGFRPAFQHGLRYRSEAYDPSFFVLELAPGALSGISGWVRYHEAFERL